MKTQLLTLFLIILSLSVYSQSGWVREKGKYFIKQDFNYFESDDYYNLEGNRVETSVFRQTTLQLYAEYGIMSRLAINASFPVYRWNSFETTEKVSGIGDARIELKYAIMKGKFPLSISVAPEFPTGPSELFAQNKNFIFERANLPTGDGELNVWNTIALSHSLSKIPMYLSVFTAYNYRTEYEGREFQDQLESGLEVGYQFFGSLWLIHKTLIREGMGEDPERAGFIRGDGTTFTAHSIQAMWQYHNSWGVSFQYFNYSDLIIPRRNLYSDGLFSFGILYELK